MDFNRLTMPVSAMGAVLIVALSGFLWMDEHFAKAADVGQIKTEVTQAVLESRRQYLEDQIFAIENDPKAKASQTAILNRFKSQLQDVERKIDALTRK